MSTNNLDPTKYVTLFQETEDRTTQREIQKEALQATIDLLNGCDEKCYITLDSEEREYTFKHTDGYEVNIYALGLDKYIGSLVFIGKRRDLNEMITDWTDVTCLYPYGILFYFFVAKNMIEMNMIEKDEADAIFRFLLIKDITSAHGIVETPDDENEDDDIKINIQF